MDRWLSKVVLTTVVLALGALAAGDKPAEYVRNGVRYGVVEGRFRGRWWNYYERGRSFLDGAFWAEAESDFRAALTGRGRDQRWPRTYGLHFVPEYFPHRELGIALLRTERIPEAIEELEASIEQQYSARAAYYLDEARLALIDLVKTDTAAPTIEIGAPQSDARIGALEVEVRGVARDDTFVKVIAVNGVPWPVAVSAPEIPFSQAISLQPGDNQVMVAVTDLTGKDATRTVFLFCDVDGPAVSFDRAVGTGDIVTGVLFDPAGVASMRIGGEEAALSDKGAGMAAFACESARASLPFEAFDTLGNVTRGRTPSRLVASSSVRGYGPFPDSGRVVSVGLGSRMLMVGGYLYTVTAALPEDSRPGPVSVRFLEMRDGQAYRLPQIDVQFAVDAENTVAAAEVNGFPVPVAPGRRSQDLSRRVNLPEAEEGPVEFEIVATATDAVGNAAEAKVKIERVATPLELPVGRLNVAVLGHVWEGNSPTFEGAAGMVTDWLEGELFNKYERFCLVDRGNLDVVLTEQLISELLAKRSARLQRGLQAAEVIVVGRIHRDSEGVEIILQASSTETGLKLAIVDVAGPVNSRQELNDLVAALALRLVQAFPDAKGTVVKVQGRDRIVSTLGKRDGVQTSTKMVVFHEGERLFDPDTGADLGAEIELVGYGLVQSAQESKSTVSFASASEDDEGVAVAEGHAIATK
ncbi:MAG TPA: hypothetical protein HPP77_02325 [Candidatus Hydrogenedentes bacterium]|nr:hypothetical protein [Candidatus Hydrogenedentota bacterium]